MKELFAFSSAGEMVEQISERACVCACIHVEERERERMSVYEKDIKLEV